MKIKKNKPRALDSREIPLRSAVLAKPPSAVPDASHSCVGSGLCSCRPAFSRVLRALFACSRERDKMIPRASAVSLRAVVGAVNRLCQEAWLKCT